MPGTWPTSRHMSPQAWRRLRDRMRDEELHDLAKDLAAFTGADADELAVALTSVDWIALPQAPRR